MANNENQSKSKQYRIYIKEAKRWVDVNKEFYTNYYRDINAYRKRQQEHGRCVCPASKRYLCDKPSISSLTATRVDGSVPAAWGIYVQSKSKATLTINGAGSVLRTAVIFFYISNEGVSLLENAAHLGLPVPEKIKIVLEQLHDRAESEDK